MSWWIAEVSSHPLVKRIEKAETRLSVVIAEAGDDPVMPRRAVEILRWTGVFRMAVPADMGGLQADPAVQLRAVERLSEIDATLGWYANIGSDGGYYAAFLDEAAAKDLYADPDVVTAGFTDPVGHAVPTTGGYLVSGHWPFGSASAHATWLASGCTVLASDGNHEPRRRIVAVLPRAACVLDEDSWRALGLRHSGSFNYSTTGTFVPYEHVFSLHEKPRRTDPLYRYPAMYRCNAPGVPLGIARGALADFTAALEAGRDPETGRPARESPDLQRVLSRATGKTQAARAYAYSTVDELWSRLVAGAEPTPVERASFRLMLAETTDMCRTAVLELFHANGGRAVYDGNPLQRRLRDILTAGQHALANVRTYPMTGSVLAGLTMTDPLL